MCGFTRRDQAGIPSLYSEPVHKSGTSLVQDMVGNNVCTGSGPHEMGKWAMRELVRTNDAVLVSAIGALLDGAGIHYLVFDQNMSVIEGSIGILPQRILVDDSDMQEARSVLTDAGLANEMRPDE